jgi:hypothetical protein
MRNNIESIRELEVLFSRIEKAESDGIRIEIETDREIESKTGSNRIGIKSKIEAEIEPNGLESDAKSQTESKRMGKLQIKTKRRIESNQLEPKWKRIEVKFQIENRTIESNRMESSRDESNRKSNRI